MSPRLLPVSVVAALLLSACQRVTDTDRQAAVDCVRANLAAMEKGDVAAVLATVHPKSAAYRQMPQNVQAITSKYQLTYVLETAEVEQAASDGIKVHFVQVTRKAGGEEEFPDNRIEGVHLLKRDGSTWKIWSTQVRQARTLDGKPLPSR
jgi:hypothetical protein